MPAACLTHATFGTGAAAHCAGGPRWVPRPDLPVPCLDIDSPHHAYTVESLHHLYCSSFVVHSLFIYKLSRVKNLYLNICEFKPNETVLKRSAAFM